MFADVRIQHALRSTTPRSLHTPPCSLGVGRCPAVPRADHILLQVPFASSPAEDVVVVVVLRRCRRSEGECCTTLKTLFVRQVGRVE